MDRKEYFKEYNKNRPKKRRPNHEERVANFRAKRKEDPEYWRWYSTMNYHKNKNNDRPCNKKENKLWWAAKKRATAKNLPFDLEKSDIVIPDECPICLQEMLRPSLDQIKPGEGYTKHNTAVICTSCNTIKSFGTAEDHRRIADWMDFLSWP